MYSSKSYAFLPIKVGVYIEPPYVNYVNNEFVGINIDIIKSFAQRLNTELIYTPCPFIRCILLVKEGQIDVVVGIQKSPERAKYMQFLAQPFSIQYYPLNFYLLQDSQLTINNYNDLKKLRIGTIRGALYFDTFDQDNALIKMPVTTYEQLIQLLLKGRIDTFPEREESITPWLSPDNTKQQLKAASFHFQKAVGSYFAISKKSQLVDQLQRLNDIQQLLITSGKIDEIYEKWREK
ncbi:ABC transporter substrate-binding protein [Thalassotalea insulae]|uniref:ABC transporter substrate-binding protein n=2 Tax=Thalassotalea insulae TaxID=2056778 RepID=A0ABQ6GP37_9GAMM|nr:ABC transporter substrate-binding protein [Thalassotalea insulae]